MLGREVWGWRALALLFAFLLIFTIPQSDTIKSEWKDSIEGNLLSTDESNSSDVERSDIDGDEGNAEENSKEEDSSDQDPNVESDDKSLPGPSMESTEIDNSNPEDGLKSPDWILPATQIIVLTMMAIMAVGLITSTSFALLTSEAARFSILLAVVGPLIAITQRGEGGIFTRGRILGFIEAHPGIYFSALRDALSLGNGVTAHHIQILERQGRIISWMDRKVRRFASSGTDPKRLKEIRSPVVGLQVAILQILSENEQLGIKSGDLRAKLETSRQLLSYHMKQLTDRELVKSSGKGRALRWSLLEAGKKELGNSAHLNLTTND